MQVRQSTGSGSREIVGRSGKTLIQIPFAKDSAEFISAILFAWISSNDTTYKMLYHWQYQQFSFIPRNDSVWDAQDVFNAFTYFEQTVFNHNSFMILDTALFRSQSGYNYSIMTRGTTTSQESVRFEAVEECGAWEICHYNVPGEDGGGGFVRTNVQPGPACATVEICTTYYYETGGGFSTGGGNGGGSSTSGGGDPWGNPCQLQSYGVNPCTGGFGWSPMEYDPNTANPINPPADFINANPTATDCGSFEFTNTASNWQEAGVMGIQFRVYYIGTNGFKVWLDCTVNQVVIGFSKRVTHGQAANMSAKAVDYARMETYLYVRSNGGAVTEAQAIQYFRNKLNEIVRQKGGTASVNGSSSPLIKFNVAESSNYSDPYDC